MGYEPTPTENGAFAGRRVMTNEPPHIPSHDGGNPTEFDGAGLPREDRAQSEDADFSPGPMMSQGASPTNWADQQLQQFVDDQTEIPPDMLDEQKAVLLKPGDMVNERFEVVKQLGFGGMGAVYHVKDRQLGTERALKVMLPSLLKSDTARERFHAEVIISQQLGHDNIVRIHDLMVDRARNTSFFTMELVEGKTLNRVLTERGGRLPVDEALHIAHQLCDALAYAHRTTVHRDLKPQNIMVQPDGTIKILDFGLAKLMSPGRLTKSSMALGTAYYQSPEQSIHLSELDQRADLYSVGIILYQMLTGIIPSAAMKPPSKEVRDVPRRLDPVVMRCLARRPEDRYPNAQALDAALTTAEGSGKGQWIYPVGVAAAIVAIIAAMLFMSSRNEDGRPGGRPYQESDVAQASSPASLSLPEPDMQARTPALPGAETSEQGEGPGPPGPDEATPVDEEAPPVVADEPAREAQTQVQRETIEPQEPYEARAQASEEGQDRRGGPRPSQGEDMQARTPALHRTGTVDPAAEEVARLLAQSRDLIAKDQLTSPRENNAYEVLTEILATDPDNDAAKAGMQSIIDRYGELAQASLAKGDWTKVKNYAERAAHVPGDHGQLERLVADAEKRAAQEAQPGALTQAAPPVAEAEKRATQELQPGQSRTFAGIEMVWIPAGSFDMGSPKDEKGRDKGETQHRVTLTKGFWMGKYEVTQAQWQAVMGNNPSRFKGSNLPVEEVSWNDCQDFIRKLNAKGQGAFRLPTEAEWEYACRAGTQSRFCFGDSDSSLGTYAWYRSNSGWKTHEVGQKSPNRWNLYDMHGNVWEWCQDWKGDYPSGSVTDPTGPSTGSGRVRRGGGWRLNPRYCRSADRSGGGPGLRRDDLGFRLARAADR